MTDDLLFEIGTEELPAGYILPALDFMEKEMRRRLRDLSLNFQRMKTGGTPRRLMICVQGLDSRQPDRREQVTGPSLKVAFDVEGKPTKAAKGFASSRGGSVEDLQVVSTPKGEYVMLIQELKGRDSIDLLQEELPGLIKDIPFPKSMRWGANSYSFARPIQWLLALFGQQVINFSFNDLTASDTTRGHRFLAPEEVKVKDCDQYISILREREVIVDFYERRQKIEKEVKDVVSEVGAEVIDDQELLDTVTNLVEMPVPVCGSFDRKFLELPPEVLISAMREHQKYFTVVDQAGRILPWFIAVNNTRVSGQVNGAAGHERVLRARLEDALFFYNEDRKKNLEERLPYLNGVIFQAQLGSMGEKANRLEGLAAYLAAGIVPDQQYAVIRAARLAKADLVTDLVGEFPTLQGVMGKYYALADGEDKDVAQAIADHYLPVRSGGRLPATTAGAVVGLADRFDTLAGCFGIGEKPTGTADPYGLRRHALALIHIITGYNLNISLKECAYKALGLYGGKLSLPEDRAAGDMIDFIKGRFVNDLISRGVSSEAVEAVTSLGFDNVVSARKRIDSLLAISTREAFGLLAGSFKRLINIVSDQEAGEVDPELFREEAERNLYDKYQSIKIQVEPLVAREEFLEAMEKILEMKEAVDYFFDKVMVMAEDKDLRRNRLTLLASIVSLFLLVGDFSKMSSI
ncbi:MAG: glycine--tRNA ligase subunit beta [Thermodesulfobacteriota bacterium]